MSGTAPDSRDDSGLIHPPLWRFRVSPERRHAVAFAWFAAVVAVGLAIMWAAWWVCAAVDAPPFVRVLVWLAPTVGVLVWVSGRAGPARSEHVVEQTWLGYVVRFVFIGEDTPRPFALRVVAAVVFGAPVGWGFIIISIATILGIM